MGAGQSVISNPSNDNSAIINDIDNINVEDNPNSYEPVENDKFDVNTTEYFIKKKNNYVSIGQYTGETKKETFKLQGLGSITDTFYIFKDNSGKEYSWNSSTTEHTPEQIYILAISGGKKTRNKTNKKMKPNRKQKTKTKNKNKKQKQKKLK